MSPDPNLPALCADDPYVRIIGGHIEIVRGDVVLRLNFLRNVQELVYMLNAAAQELVHVPIAERGWGPR